jgi:hypothetical protein
MILIDTFKAYTVGVPLVMLCRHYYSQQMTFL